MKKKILHIIESTATGTLSALQGLANSQCNEGNYVTIIYSKRPDTPKNLNEYFDPKIDLINIQMSTPISALNSLYKIYKQINLFQPNYVFLASSWAGFIGRLVGLFISKKVLFFYIPHCISYIRKDIGIIKKFIFISLELVASLKKSVIIAVSASELKEIQKYIKLSPSYLVENAVSNVFLDRKSPEKKIRKIITVGGIRPQKDPESFAKITKGVRDIDKTISFSWIGDGDEKLKKYLLNSEVEVTGWLDPVEVKDKLLSSTLYISTAKWEGMPITILEALACGLPVIAFNCPGNEDIIKDKNFGLVFNTNNEAIDKILEIINDNKKINQMSMAAFDIVKNWFNYDRYNNEINNLIKEIEENNKI